METILQQKLMETILWQNLMKTILWQNLMETILLVKVICTKGYAQSDGTIGWKISMYKFMEKGAPIGQIRGS